MALGAGTASMFRGVISRGLRLMQSASSVARLRTCIDAIIRKASLQCPSERPAGIRIGSGGDDDHLSRSLSSACLARYAY